MIFYVRGLMSNSEVINIFLHNSSHYYKQQIHTLTLF